MGALLDFILLLVTVRAVWRLVAGVAAGMAGKRAGAPSPFGWARGTVADAQRSGPASRSGSPDVPAVHMARDPVCGTFVVPDRAVSLSEGGRSVYFCSPACRDRYRAHASRTA